MVLVLVNTTKSSFYCVKKYYQVRWFKGERKNKRCGEMRKEGRMVGYVMREEGESEREEGRRV